MKILYNFSKVSKLADDIRDRNIDEYYLKNYSDSNKNDLGINFLKIMILGRILTDKKSWIIEGK